MYTLYKFHFLNGISEINQLFDDILIIWPAPVYQCNILAELKYEFLSKKKKENLYCLYTFEWRYILLQKISIFNKSCAF